MKLASVSVSSRFVLFCSPSIINEVCSSQRRHTAGAIEMRVFHELRHWVGHLSKNISMKPYHKNSIPSSRFGLSSRSPWFSVPSSAPPASHTLPESAVTPSVRLVLAATLQSTSGCSSSGSAPSSETVSLRLLRLSPYSNGRYLAANRGISHGAPRRFCACKLLLRFWKWEILSTHKFIKTHCKLVTILTYVGTRVFTSAIIVISCSYCCTYAGGSFFSICLSLNSRSLRHALHTLMCSDISCSSPKSSSPVAADWTFWTAPAIAFFTLSTDFCESEKKDLFPITTGTASNSSALPSQCMCWSPRGLEALVSISEIRIFYEMKVDR